MVTSIICWYQMDSNKYASSFKKKQVRVFAPWCSSLLMNKH